eukprot:TRINITY_DN5995_c0_g1_i1.p1 TRINITY_DN5995_c0_g1~~TRINITY_DN5995_c0_g1_i1.p1  ORF type:complete len:248 (-),score=30.13 TRINITY_DN5995_c0_g1_i1:61-804(-)
MVRHRRSAIELRLLLVVVVVTFLGDFWLRPVHGQYDNFPDLCSFDWHAQMTVNGTKNGVAFGPEPAQEWSSFSSQQFRYYLPQHDYFDPIFNVGEGGTISNDNAYDTSLLYVYTSSCCSGYPTSGPWQSCSNFFSCNILGIGVLNEVCMLVQQWQMTGQQTIMNQECQHWEMASSYGPEHHEFWVTTSDQTPVLYHWTAGPGSFKGINEFEEWLVFNTFERGTLSPSIFDIKDVAPTCYPNPTTTCQ